MEKSIRHNVSAIAVVSFCIGLLYGMNARAESPSVEQYSTNSLIAGMNRTECNDAKNDAKTEINEAKVRLDNEAVSDVVHEKAMAKGDATPQAVAAVRQRAKDSFLIVAKQMSSTLETLKDTTRCENQDSDLKTLVSNLSASQDAVNAQIADLTKKIGK
jgi:hypothetical protein